MIWTMDSFSLKWRRNQICKRHWVATAHCLRTINLFREASRHDQSSIRHARASSAAASEAVIKSKKDCLRRVQPTSIPLFQKDTRLRNHTPARACTQVALCFTHIKAEAQEPAVPLLLSLVHIDVLSVCACNRFEQVWGIFSSLSCPLKPEARSSSQHSPPQKNSG